MHLVAEPALVPWVGLKKRKDDHMMPWGNENFSDKHMPFYMRLCNRSTIQGGEHRSYGF
jgi:hypothetical protein